MRDHPIHSKIRRHLFSTIENDAHLINEMFLLAETGEMHEIISKDDELKIRLCCHLTTMQSDLLFAVLQDVPGMDQKEIAKEISKIRDSVFS